jgi:hypothetical protein
MHGKKSVAEVMTLMAFGMEVKNWFVKKQDQSMKKNLEIHRNVR